MASRFNKAMCPTCGKFVSVREDYESENQGTVLNHKNLSIGERCRGGFGLPLPGESGYKPFAPMPEPKEPK